MKKIIWEKWAFSALWKPLDPRLILWKLKLFHFSSIKSSRRVISSFWCYRKFLLTPETILDTLDVCWNRLDDFFRPSFKNYVFGEILFFFLTCLAYFSLLLKKRILVKKIFFKLGVKKSSRRFQHTSKVSRMVSGVRRNFL